jgi:serine protease inhibitor
MKIISIIVVIVFTVFIVSCSKNSDPSNSENTSETVKSKLKSAQILGSSNKFGLNLLKSVNHIADTQNVFISPFSVLQALSMTYNGANGLTKDEMANVLGFSDYSELEINNYNQSLTAALLAADAKVAFEVANSIWYRNGFTILKPFIDVNQTYYNANVNQLDFSSPAALEIPTILDNIPLDAVMYLINAIYFKGSWKYQFDKTKTSEELFYRTESNSVLHTQMSMEAEVNYMNTPEFQSVEIPYGNGTFNFVILLPQIGNSLNNLVSKLNESKWDSITEHYNKTKVVLKMPKFKQELKGLLNTPLKNLGMVKAFNDADFSGIDGSNDLLISRVIHKTFIDINEEGTEAAAVTAVEIIKTSIGDNTDSPQFFNANRPFVYAITEKSTGAILFIGKYINPSSNITNLD